MDNDTLQNTGNLFTITQSDVGWVIIALFFYGIWRFASTCWKNRGKNGGTLPKSKPEKQSGSKSWFEIGSLISSYLKAKLRKILGIDTWARFSDDSIGYYIGPFEMQIVRLVFSILAGVLSVVVLIPTVHILEWVISLFIESQLDVSTFPWSAYFIIGSLVAYVSWQSKEENFLKIPFNHVGVITFFGNRYEIYLREGDYTWRGQSLFLDISTQSLLKTKDEGEKLGFPLMQNRVIPIWDDTKDKNTTMSNLAKNDNHVTLSATITIRTVNPKQWMKSDDPILHIAEQVRASIRIAVNSFLDVDVSALKSAFPKLLTGETLLIAFTLESFGTHAVNKVVRSKSGSALFRLVNLDTKHIKEGKLRFDDPEERQIFIENEERIFINKQKIKFLEEELIPRADPLFLQATTPFTINPQTQEKTYCTKEAIPITAIRLEENLLKAIDDVGAKLVKVAISDTDLSPEVKKAAEKAASEMLLRRSQENSAITYEGVAKILVKSGMDEKTALLVALKMDNVDGIELSHLTSDREQDGHDNPEIIKAANLFGNLLKK